MTEPTPTRSLPLMTLSGQLSLASFLLSSSDSLPHLYWNRKTLYGCRAIISRRCTRLEGIIQQQRSTTNSGSNDPAVLPIVRVQGADTARPEAGWEFFLTGAHQRCERGHI